MIWREGLREIISSRDTNDGSPHENGSFAIVTRSMRW